MDWAEKGPYRSTISLAAPGPKLLLVLSAAAWFIGLYQVEGTTAQSHTLSHVDASFCQGGLEVTYPEVHINKCLIISQNLREKISKVWDAPQINFERADKTKKYVLMMVDPDAPSRTNPTRAHWRHWLVVDIKGTGGGSLESAYLFLCKLGIGLRGNFKGKTLSEYSRPTPPQRSGLHRYQFFLFEQPADTTLSLTKEEKSTLGNWDPQAFIRRFDLGVPVATVQFLTQNYKD